MRNIPLLIHADRLEVSEYHSKLIKQSVTDSGGPIRATIVPHIIESPKQRRYLHGCLLPLWAYMDGNDYIDSETLERYFEDFKLEHFPETLKIHGKVKLFGKSSRGAKALNKVVEKLTDMLVEEYGLSYTSPVLITDNYKQWRDELASFSTESFIEYAERMKWIDKHKML